MLKGSANYSELTATLLSKSGKHSARTQTDEMLFIIYPAAETSQPTPMPPMSGRDKKKMTEIFAQYHPTNRYKKPAAVKQKVRALAE